MRALPEVAAVEPGPVVRLRFPWRRFPARLGTVLVPGAPGPFRLVSGSPDRIVAARPGLRLVFRRLDPRAAVALFRRGLLDEAPVPEGDLRAAAAAGSLRVRPILAVDAFVVSPGGVLARKPELRSVYWQTADRLDYAALVPELEADPAYGLLTGGGDVGRASPALLRSARAQIPTLPRVAVALGAEPGLEDDAAIVWAQWRELGLGPELGTPRRPAAVLRRLTAAYPEPEALLAPLLPRSARLALLAASDQSALLRRDDAALQARVIPLAWAVDARLVSPRLEGWREDSLGVPDYRDVRIR